jgi:hypothetical protein
MGREKNIKKTEGILTPVANCNDQVKDWLNLGMDPCDDFQEASYQEFRLRTFHAVEEASLPPRFQDAGGRVGSMELHQVVEREDRRELEQWEKKREGNRCDNLFQKPCPLNDGKPTTVKRTSEVHPTGKHRKGACDEQWKQGDIGA